MTVIQTGSLCLMWHLLSARAHMHEWINGKYLIFQLSLLLLSLALMVQHFSQKDFEFALFCFNFICSLYKLALK